MPRREFPAIRPLIDFSDPYVDPTMRQSDVQSLLKAHCALVSDFFENVTQTPLLLS